MCRRRTNLFEVSRLTVLHVDKLKKYGKFANGVYHDISFFPGNNFVSSAKLTHQKVFSYNLFSIQNGLLTSMEIVLNKGIAV